MSKTHPRPCAASSLAVLALFVLAGCKPAAAPKAAAAPPVPVQVATATREDVPRRLESIGTVQAVRTVAIKSQVDGIVARTIARPA